MIKEIDVCDNCNKVIDEAIPATIIIECSLDNYGPFRIKMNHAVSKYTPRMTFCCNHCLCDYVDNKLNPIRGSK